MARGSHLTVTAWRVENERCVMQTEDPPPTHPSPTSCHTPGELRGHESSTNQGWKVRRYWLDEVARVMPDWQKEDARRTRSNRRNWGGFKSTVSRADDATAEDYALLGLPRDPPPTAKAIGAAFRAVAMTSHPDRQQVCDAWSREMDAGGVCDVRRSMRRCGASRDGRRRQRGRRERRLVATHRDLRYSSLSLPTFPDLPRPSPTFPDLPRPVPASPHRATGAD